MYRVGRLIQAQGEDTQSDNTHREEEEQPEEGSRCVVPATQQEEELVCSRSVQGVDRLGPSFAFGSVFCGAGQEGSVDDEDDECCETEQKRRLCDWKASK